MRSRLSDICFYCLFILCIPLFPQAATVDTLYEEYFDTETVGDAPVNWTVSTSSGGDASIGDETSSTASNSMRLRWNEVSAELTTGVDTSGRSSVDVKVWVRMGGSFSEKPDQNEDLLLEYLNSGGSWIELNTYLGVSSGSGGTIFNDTYTLPQADAHHANFKIRFSLAGGSGPPPPANKDDDYWHIDDIIIEGTQPTQVNAEWRFDEFNWGIVAPKDSTGHGLEGTVNGDAYTQTESPDPALAGNPGSCAYGVFDGTGDYISVADNDFLDFDDEVTVTAWVYISSLAADDMTLISKGNNYKIHITSTGNIKVEWPGTSVTALISTTALTTGGWYHIAMVYSDTQDLQEIYINTFGSSNTADASSSSSDALTPNTGPLTIASDQTATYFNGFIEEIRIYDGALSSGEIITLKNDTHPCTISGASDITVTFTSNVDEINAGSVSLIGTRFGAPAATEIVANSDTATSSISTSITTNTGFSWLIDVVGTNTNGTYTAAAGQQKRWEEATTNASGSMSTRQLPLANTVLLSHAHTNINSNFVHAAIAFAPYNSENFINFDVVNSTNDTSISSITWEHALGTTTTANTKLIVGISYTEAIACNETISGITYGNIDMKLAIRNQQLLGSTCQTAEIWYIDLTSVILSTKANVEIGGLSIDGDEALEYIGSSDFSGLFFSENTYDVNSELDAIHVKSNGNLLISTTGNSSISGSAFENGDIVELAPTVGVGLGVYSFVSIVFDESAIGVALDIDAVFERDDGTIIFSTAEDETLPSKPLTGGGTLSVEDEDLVLWDPTPSTGGASMFLDESAVGLLNSTNDINAVHLIDDNPNLILFSIDADDTSLGGVSVDDGDIVLYNASAGTVEIYLAETRYVTNNLDVDAITLPVEPSLGSKVDHYAISYSLNPAATCDAVIVTVTGHDEFHDEVHPDSLTIVISLDNPDVIPPGQGAINPSLITWSITNSSANPGSFLDNGDGTYEYTFTGDINEKSVSFDLRYLAPITVDIDVTDFVSTDPDGDPDAPPIEDADLVVANSIFQLIEGITVTSVTTKIAGKDSDSAGFGQQTDIRIQAIKDDGSGGACVGTFQNQSVDFEMATECLDPSTCASKVISVKNNLGVFTATGSNNMGINIDGSGYVPITLQFDANSAAPIVFNYPDAGQVNLHARYDLSQGVVAAPDTPYMHGNTGAFVVRPFGIAFTNISSGGTPNPGGSTPGDTLFISAGTSFQSSIAAYTWDVNDDSDLNGIPDFGADITDNGTSVTQNFNATVNSVSVLENNPTVAQGGVIGGFSYDPVTMTSGIGNINNIEYLEVGSILFIVNVNDYILSGINISGRSDNGGDDNPNGIFSSGAIGRFGADQFTYTTNTPSLGAGCGTFTYIDQPFDYTTAPLITARATAADGTTVLTNYEDFTGSGGDNWWLLNFASGITMGYTDLATTPANMNFDAISADYTPNTGTTGVNGLQVFTLSGPFTYADRNAAPVIPQDPFNGSLRLDFSVTDADGATGGQTINPLNFSASEQRWGRLVVGKEVGDESLVMNVPLTAEYYDAGVYLTNPDDNCTTYNLVAEIDISNIDSGPQDGDQPMSIGASTTSITSGNPALAAGIHLFTFSAPGTGNTGFVDIEVDLSTALEEWFLFDWDGDGVYDNHPVGRATFGIISRPKQVIYTREPW